MLLDFSQSSDVQSAQTEGLRAFDAKVKEIAGNNFVQERGRECHGVAQRES